MTAVPPLIAAAASRVGEQVLALLMREVRADPVLRRMMEEQGVWSQRYDDTADPEPLVIGEAERVAGFRKATGGMEGAVRRWRERAANGMSDTELWAALAYEIGIFGGASSPWRFRRRRPSVTG